MQPDPDDIEGSTREVAAHGDWMETITQWRNSPPVIVDHAAGGASLARLADDDSDDPVVWVGAPVNPFDAATFAPRRLSTVPDAVKVPDYGRFEYPNLLTWYGTIDPQYDQMGGATAPTVDVPLAPGGATP